MFELESNVNLSINVKPQKKDLSWIADDVLVIILLNKNTNFKGTFKPYEIEIFGKKMWEWVALCADECIIKTLPCTEESDILSLIKPMLTDAKYTAVFYSDTPLLTRETFLEILDYIEYRQQNVLKLSRGYVFNTDYIKNASSIVNNQVVYFNEEDFLTCYDYKQLALASEILKSRILDFHLKNGVQIQDLSTTFIDSDVVIESGVIIEANNIIKGQSFIGKNCRLKPFNYIENSIISDGVSLSFSSIIESKISENLNIGPFKEIRKKSI